jgi:uncharacterized protein YlxW (UPF0749 family)
MGSDLFMESRNRPCPPVDVVHEVDRVVTERNNLQSKVGELTAQVSALEEQGRRDAQTIVKLTRERDAAYAALAGVRND